MLGDLVTGIVEMKTVRLISQDANTKGEKDIKENKL
jgi:hypothetical protein